MNIDNSPALSVIVPVYNVEDYLAECLDSILRQSLKDIEILAVDDGSTDSSAEIIRVYASKDSRIKPLFKENGGLSDARNYGLDRVSGKYITFIDSDDVLLDDNIFGNIISYLETHKDIDAVQYDVVYKWNSPYENKLIHSYGLFHGEEDILRGYLNGNIHVSCWDKVFRTEVFDNIRFPKGEISEDIAIISEITRKVKVIFVSDFGYYGYRYREGSISTSAPKPEKIYSILRSYNKYLTYCLKYKALKKETISIYSSLIWNYIAVMRRSNKEFLDEFFEQPVFINLTFYEWFKCRGNSIEDMIKSFLVCVAGAKATYRFQSLFIK